MHRCPVCGADLHATRQRKYVTEYRGRTFHFCSPEHRREFTERPGVYLSSA